MVPNQVVDPLLWIVFSLFNQFAQHCLGTTILGR